MPRKVEGEIDLMAGLGEGFCSKGKGGSFLSFAIVSKFGFGWELRGMFLIYDILFSYAKSNREILLLKILRLHDQFA